MSERPAVSERIEFRDSRLIALAQVGDDVWLDVDDHVHRWERIDGVWKGTGWSQGLPLYISDGRIETAGEIYVNIIPLGFAAPGPVRVTFYLETGQVLHCSGGAIALEAIADPEPVDDIRADMNPFLGE